MIYTLLNRVIRAGTLPVQVPAQDRLQIQIQIPFRRGPR